MVKRLYVRNVEKSLKISGQIPKFTLYIDLVMKNKVIETLTEKETKLFNRFCKGMDSPFTGWLHEMAEESRSTSGLVSSLVKKGLITSSEDHETGSGPMYYIEVTKLGGNEEAWN